MTPLNAEETEQTLELLYTIAEAMDIPDGGGSIEHLQMRARQVRTLLGRADIRDGE